MGTDFWAVTLQVVPVIALALVIETRAYARQVRSKRAFASSRGQRVGFVIIAALALIALLVAFSISLSALKATTEVPEIHRSIVSYSLSFSFGVVAGSPLLTLFLALTSDVRADRKIKKRLRRNSNSRLQLQRTIKWAERISRERNLELLTKFANNYTRAMASARRLESQGGRADLLELHSVYEYIDELDAWRVSYELDRLEETALIDRGRELLVDSEGNSGKLSLQPYLRELHRLVD